MEALARILVLVKRGAVEAGEPVLVGREVSGNPVEDDADAGAVGAVDEAREAANRDPWSGSPRTGRTDAP